MGHYIAHDHTITKENESEDKDLDENPILLSRSLGLSCDRVIELEDTPAQEQPRSSPSIGLDPGRADAEHRTNEPRVR